MNVLVFTLGVVVLVVAVSDLLWTTLWVEGGAGPLTARTMDGTWTAFRRLSSPNSRLLTVTGPVLLSLTIATWTVLLWSGWTLIFASGEGAIVDTVAGRPVSWSDLVYFTGYTVFTLGLGDFVPRTPVWQLATAVASATGLLFFTLSITYVISVLDAVTQKHSFASGVSGLGARSTEILTTSWDGDTFRGLDVPLDRIATQLDTLTSNHKAYPILHYFYAESAEQAPTVRIAALDGALTLLEYGVPEQTRPSRTITSRARSSVGRYLDTVGETYVEPADTSPPAPDLDALRDAGIPTVTDREFEAALAKFDDRRRALFGLVQSDERRWPTGADD